MRQRRFHFLFSMALLAMLICTACGSNSSATTTTPTSSGLGVLDSHKQYTVNFWEVFDTGANKTALAALTNQYMQMHPNVKVNLDAYDSYGTLNTKLNAAIAAHQPPAIAQVYETWATQYQQNNQLASLQPYISGANGLSQSDLADFYPSLLADGNINGTQYMLPFNKSDEVLYYNPSLLQKAGLQPPTSLQDFLNDLTKTTKPDGSQWGLSITPDDDLWDILYKSLGGKNFVSSDGQSAAFDQGTDKGYALSALSTLVPYVKSGAVHVTTGYSWEDDFISQKSAFGITTIASYPFLLNKAFQPAEVPIPAGPGGQYTVLFGTNLSLFNGVSEDSRTAAWDYMKFLVSKEADISLVKGTGYMPIRLSAFNSPDLQSYYASTPARKVGPSVINNAFVPSILPGWEKCGDDIVTAYTSVLKSQTTADAGLAKMAQSCTSDLAD